MTQPIEQPPSSWAPSAQTVDRSPEVSGSEQLITIIGIARRFPAADGIPASCRMLEDGVNPVQEPGSGSGVEHMARLFPSAHVQSVASRYDAYLDGFDPFEATFFRISPFQSQFRAPHQLLVLETCSRALEDAPLNPAAIRGTRTAVCAGITNNEYRNLILRVSETVDATASFYTVTAIPFNTAMDYAVTPRPLRFRIPNSQLNWNRLPLYVTANPETSPFHNDHPLPAGFTGLGWSDTNAHLMLRGYDISCGPGRHEPRMLERRLLNRAD